MEANQTSNWTSFLPTIAHSYNQQYITGTKIKRASVDSSNYLTALNAIYKHSDASLLFNSYSMGKFSPEMSKTLFRFQISQKVWLQRKLDHNITRKSQFEKPSDKGSFSNVYTIKERSLKHDSKNFLAPVYKLHGISGYFYSSELRAYEGDD
jgi:hypothetical protein